MNATYEPSIQYMTVNELAARWKLSRQTIHLMKDKGLLPYYWIAQSVRFRIEDVEAYEANARRVRRG